MEMLAVAGPVLSIAGTLFAADSAEQGATQAAQGSMASARAAEEAATAARTEAFARQGLSEFVAKQLDVNAGQSVAAAQRTAAEQRRQATITASRALALAAASGGGASDVTVTNLLGRIAGEGAYRAGVALYEGEEQARLYRMGATAKRYEGALDLLTGERVAKGYLAQAEAFGLQADAYENRGETESTSILLSGAGKAAGALGPLYSKYGGSGPSGDSALLQGGFDFGGTYA